MDLINKFNEDGYIVIPNLISEHEIKNYKKMLESYHKKYSPHYPHGFKKTSHGLNDKTNEKVVYNLHNKDLKWYDLIAHPKILPILDVILKEGSYKNSELYYMNNNSARNPLLNNPGQQLHSDSRLPGINYCLVANVIWMIDDFTDTNGATRVVPKSHKIREFAKDGESHKDEILITGKRGSALIFNANLWHGGGPNHDGTSRWAYALGYARWFIKPSFDYMRNTPSEIYNALDDNQKKLMGFCNVPPKDEFTRLRRISQIPEVPFDYNLPNF